MTKQEKTPLTPQEFETHIKKQQLDDITNNINNSFDEIVGNNVRGKLPEQLFVQHFLPFFSGQVASKDAHQHYKYWIGIAGTPMNEVDVISPKGETLFTVPPLMNTDFVNSTKRGKAIQDIFTEFQMHTAHSPASGETFLANELTNRINEFEDTEVLVKTTEERWASILDRYGVKLPNAVDGETVKSEKSAKGDDPEELIYD